MADRYWVGGTGTWNTTSTTNWSASSGGAGGASVPTVADSVFFDQASTYTVTMTGALACLDITVSAGTVTFATGTTPTLDVRGSMSLLAGTVWNSTGAITFSSTSTGRTVTTNGVTLSGSVTFNGVGGGWTLGSALTLAVGNRIFSVVAGTFDTSSTGNYSITCGQFRSEGSTTRALNLNASTITYGNGVSGGIFAMTSTGLTFNVGTSTFTTNQIGNTLVLGGLTYYNFSFTNTGSINNTQSIQGTNTFNNFSVAAPSSAGVTTVNFDSRQTINGTLSTTGTAGNRRVFFASATYGISQDLVVNSAPSLTDADFRGLYVRGTAAPISGTRIGNRGECRGITFSTPKTVYWNLGGSVQWNANAWATTSTGTPSTDNFPLPQDTATFTNAGAAGTVSPNVALCNVDLSARTSAFTMSFGVAVDCYGNWTNGSGVTFSGTSTLTFSGGTTQTITSAGKTFTCPITVDTYGGTVQLADALNIGTQTLTVTNGTFNTQGYAVTAGALSSSNSNVRTIALGASTLTLSGTTPVNFTTSTNLTLNANTSQINTSSTSVFSGGSMTFYNVSFTTTSAVTHTINGANTFNNVTFTAPASAGLMGCNFSANQTINGTLTCAGASPVRRIFLQSSTIGTQRTITAAAISATDCDFRDINLAGAASGASPTRAGNCDGNAGITFPGAKTVYWNLAGAQNWSATGWAPSSGGTPDINQFPLAQDTAVFDNTGSVTGTITINAAWNIGTFDASARTSAMTLTTSTNTPFVYGDWKFGTGVTSSSTTGIIAFAKNGTQTITSNGVQFGCSVTGNHPSGTVQLADALSLNSARTFAQNAGIFDAVTYNVTVGLFAAANANNRETRLGTGTWTLSGIGQVWNASGAVIAGTSTIVLSDTSTSARTFAGGGLYYNKLTIGGTTGTSTLTITGSNTFGEIASTKTVAHTITFPATQTTTVGKWAVTGTVGNVVTLNSSTPGTSWQFTIAGPATSGIDYLSVRDCLVPGTSPGEFYVGANSTNISGNTRVIFTATPAARTLYWVGGTGNWSDASRWSTSSGGGSGAAIPTSLDAVNFDSASNATAYTATIDAGVTIARCASFTMAGPLSGNVTFAGSVGIAFHGNVSFAATGITRTYTGTMNWAGNSSYTFTTNGLTLASSCTVTGVGATWTLGSALNIGTTAFTVTYGTFNTSASNYNLTASFISSNNSNVRSIVLNGSTLSFSQSPVIFTTTTNLTFNAGTSTITASNASPSFSGGGQTFYNVSFTNNNVITGVTITGANTFNTLSFASRTTVGITPVTFDSNQTITTLTLNAGTASAYRTFLASNTIGTQRTLTVTTLTAGAADYDFRDIAIAGGAAPIAPTRAGDGKGNSGITFPAAKTVYYRQTGSADWGATGSGSWSATSGGALDATQFPLAQDTAIFPAATYPASGSTTTVNANYNIGTIDMSARTANTMTLATGSTTPQIYGNWINGTGTTLTGTGNLIFAGRGSQTITSAGKIFSQPIRTDAVSGSVTLQDAITIASTTINSIQLFSGTFNANNYNVTLSSSTSAVGLSSTTNARTLAIGSGTWVIAGNGGWNATTSTNLTVTGTGTISLTSASAKTFAGGGISYSGITLDQGGAGTLTISGNNTFKDITNTYSATGAATIAFGNTTQTVTNFTGTGAATRVLTLSGTSAANPATLIITGSVGSTIDYINVSNVRGYPLTNSWKIGANSTNAGSLGFFFEASGGTTYNVTITETATALDAILAAVTFLGSLQETVTAADQVSGGLVYSSSASESTTAADSQSTAATFAGISSESAQGSEQVFSQANLSAAANEAAAAADTASAVAVLQGTITETATGADTAVAFVVFPVSVNETVTALDQVVGGLLLSATISELVAGSDSATARADFNSSASETAQGSDQSAVVASTFNAQSSESGTASDAQSATAVFPASLAEWASASESTVAALVIPGLVSETVRALDSVLSAQSHVSVIAESATASDLAQALLSLPASVSETATGADVASVVVVFRGVVAEQLSSSDLTSVAASIFNAVSQEQAQAQDSVNAPGSTYNPSTSETAQALDTPSAAATFPVAASETATIADQNAAAFTAATNISESATAADITAALVAFAALTAENASASDQTLVVPSTFNAIAAAAAQAFDSVNAPGSIYNAAVVNTAVALDSIIGAFLWNLIDDSQNPNWGDINNSQNPGWSTLNTAQGTGWTTISNPQAPGWTGIDDSQSPSWQNINNS